jgi:hypothetical protein
MAENRPGSVFANVGLPPLEYSKVMTMLYLQVRFPVLKGNSPAIKGSDFSDF